jgi:2-polyprenyl-3-methyl-5-hydroxy-6-metoxy-1,4-benzoquinol methylase
LNYSLKSLARFFEFMDSLEKETYAEEPSSIHDNISKQALEHLFSAYSIPESARILDIGCGQGVALTPLRERGYHATGITLNDTDVAICRAKGFDVHKMDQSFLEFGAASFDIIWARHVAEHSIMPYYTLTEFRRVLKTSGLMYFEVPGVNTTGHERNPNHYSVLGQQMWLSLLERSGFRTLETISYYSTCHFSATGEDIPDEFWGYYCSAR